MKYKYDREKSVYSVIGDDGQVLGEWPHIEICSQHPEYGYFFAQDENGEASLINGKGKVIGSPLKMDLNANDTHIEFLGHNLFAVKGECGRGDGKDEYKIFVIYGDKNRETEEIVQQTMCLRNVKDIISADDLNVSSSDHKNETNNQFVIQSLNDDKWYMAQHKISNDYFVYGDIDIDYSQVFETRRDAKFALNRFYASRQERRHEIYYIIKEKGIEGAIKACIDGEYDLSDLPDECFDGRYFDMLREGFKKNFESYLGQAKNHGVTKQEIEMYIKEAKVDSDYMRMRAEQVRVNVDNITAEAQKEVDDGMIF